MGHDEASFRLLAALFAAQRQAVLATQQGDQPYPSLMTFAATDDLHRLLLVTRRGTAKFANLQANPRAALLIDDRTTHPTGEDAGLAVTATGLVRESAGPDLAPDRTRFVARHPELAGFVASPGCALLALEVERYLIVRGLHDVLEWVIARANASNPGGTGGQPATGYRQPATGNGGAGGDVHRGGDPYTGGH